VLQLAQQNEAATLETSDPVAPRNLIGGSDMHPDTNIKSDRFKCPVCGKSFKVQPARIHRATQQGRTQPFYCSQTCYHRSQKGAQRTQRDTLTCEECEQPFQVKKKVTNRALREGRKPKPFCGQACFAASLKKRPEAKFWRKVTKTNGCWLWNASGLPSGYGVMAIGATRKQLAHRFSYELHHGRVSDGLRVLHRCDNPPCVRAECAVPGCKHLKGSEGCNSHLFLGTDADNNADMCEKDRNAYGSRHPKAKLTEAQVGEIRERYVPRKVTTSALAKEFHVSQVTVIRIIKGQRWRHVS
jgi:hypothetical protein